MNGTTSVLIGFTPTHLIPMLEVARDLPGRVWFFHPEAQRIPQHMRGGLSFLGGCERAGRSRLRKYVMAGLSLRRILRKGRDAVVCIPHPFNPLTNFAFFAPGAKEVRIYQDGILNYYDAANPFSKASVLTLQRLKAAAALMPYRPYTGHLSGIEAREVSTGYFTHPKLVALPARFARIVRLAFDASIQPSDQAPCDEPITLFLDQPIERSVSFATAESCRELARDFAESLGRPVVWKPHYTQRSTFVARKGWRAATAAEEAMPAEGMLAGRRIETVVSFFSSALANIRMSRSDVRCVAVGAAMVPVWINGEERTMADLLGKFGVETIDPEDFSESTGPRGA